MAQLENIEAIEKRLWKSADTLPKNVYGNRLTPYAPTLNWPATSTFYRSWG